MCWYALIVRLFESKAEVVVRCAEAIYVCHGATTATVVCLALVFFLPWMVLPLGSAGNLANPMSYQAYADALMGLGLKEEALQVLRRMLLNCHAHPRLGGLQRMYDAYSKM